jgi:hypothetical protein
MTREHRRRHHEREWVKWFMRWRRNRSDPRANRKREACVRRYCRLGPFLKYSLIPAYGLCPKTGTFHRLEGWDMAQGCADCGWEDWGTDRLADGRLYGCLCCHDKPGPTENRSELDDYPALEWTERTAAKLLRRYRGPRTFPTSAEAP